MPPAKPYFGSGDTFMSFPDHLYAKSEDVGLLSSQIYAAIGESRPVRTLPVRKSPVDLTRCLICRLPVSLKYTPTRRWISQLLPCAHSAHMDNRPTHKLCNDHKSDALERVVAVLVAAGLSTGCTPDLTSRCYLCGYPLLQMPHKDHPLKPTRDHIVPTARAVRHILLILPWCIRCAMVTNHAMI